MQFLTPSPGAATTGRTHPPWLLDGATGTELGRRGIDIGLPLWSANALLDEVGLVVLRQVHVDYVTAGVDILTANTFRCHRRSLAKVGMGDRAPELVRRAVEAARSAAHGAGHPNPSPVLVAGSIAPLEDCYRPDLVPEDAALSAEHAELAQALAAAGCDLLLVETMNTVREAVAAARAALATGLPTLVCFVCGPDGRLLSGESLADAAVAVVPLGIAAVGVNCTSAPVIARCLAELPRTIPRVAYANVGHATPDGAWVTTDAVDPAAYARYAATWEAEIIGGCCGTGPAHIAAVAAGAN
jgi:S-methylmethionine-dependent homocysteine/selenocysteine methylase